MKFNNEDLKPYLQAAINETLKGGAVDPVQFCMGIETTLKMFADSGHYLRKLKLEMGANGVFVHTLQTVDQKTYGKAPENWNVEGIWYVLFHLMTDKAPMRIASVTIGYGMKPVVEYDDSVDNGLPVALNRVYEGEKAVALMKKGVAGGPT